MDASAISYGATCASRRWERDSMFLHAFKKLWISYSAAPSHHWHLLTYWPARAFLTASICSMTALLLVPPFAERISTDFW